MKKTPLKRKTRLRSKKGLKRTGRIRRKARSKKKRKRSPKAIQKDRCHALWSRLVRLSGFCARCGRSKDDVQLHGHHLLGVGSHPRLRYKLENSICLCASHHSLGNNSAHRDPVAFTNWLMDAYPSKWMWTRENMHHKHPEVDLDATEEYLKEVWASVQESEVMTEEEK